MPNKLILCDCLGSQTLNPKKLEKATGLKCSKVFSALCTDQIASAATEIAKGDVVLACRQEQALFEELADEIGVEAPVFVDIRDRAGWSDQSARSTPKMAALVAQSLLPAAPGKAFDVHSDGRCLILGGDGVALAAAEQLCDTLAVTVLLRSPPDLPLKPDFDVILGQLKSAQGTLGNFTVRLDQLQFLQPGGRGPLAFSAPRDGGKSHCDIILDLSGGTALFHPPEKRDGYLRADPKDPQAVTRAVVEAAQMVGTFEKPFYVTLEPHMCAHSRSSIPGCSNCINACQTGAIQPDGDHVVIDPAICAGCGACAMLCPSGAISYDYPPVSTLLRRLQTLAETFRAAGGKAPRLLVCDTDHGRGMVALAARFARGLPADVIPFEVDALTSFGHAEMLAALALGFVGVDMLLAPKSEREPLAQELELARALAGARPLTLLDLTDPEALADTLYATATAAKPVTPVLPIGNRRQVTRLSATALVGATDAPVPLPDGAPYGQIIVDADACTLCLSCVSQCPSGALLDNPDTPQLRFQENACLQCGLCARACPEHAITLAPRLNLADSALAQVVLHEEEPFACISCGALFGAKSTIERIVDQLSGKHPMFATSEQGKLIQMCSKCKIEAQYHSENSPFQSAPRPATRTTDDYLKRRDH
ncbi:MAG TPA: 4Fe-4S dicluster domain-containing protein [Aliiroseovarius sp.]|nr:4Fe-4S dicluster domain-containing protein [Aliiroseovarius sp.]